MTELDLSIDPRRLRRAFHRALAERVCAHGERPCAECLILTEPLLSPLYKALTHAGLSNRKGAQGRQDGFVAIGEAVEMMGGTEKLLA